MSDVVAFLNARLGEDEVAAKRHEAAWAEAEDWVRYEWEDVPESIVELYGRFGSARVLREVEAKRKLIAECETCSDLEYHRIPETLAAVYSDHPDYDPEWAR